MFKGLTENQSAKFINQEGDTAELDEHGLLVLRGTDGERFGEDKNIRLVNGINKNHEADDWELVPKEVTWQEAIQAWLDGKSFYIEHGGTRYTQSGGGRLGCFKNNLLEGFGGGLFRDGKWYIE